MEFVVDLALMRDLKRLLPFNARPASKPEAGILLSSWLEEVPSVQKA